MTDLEYDCHACGHEFEEGDPEYTCEDCGQIICEDCANRFERPICEMPQCESSQSGFWVGDD